MPWVGAISGSQVFGDLDFVEATCQHLPSRNTRCYVPVPPRPVYKSERLPGLTEQNRWTRNASFVNMRSQNKAGSSAAHLSTSRLIPAKRSRHSPDPLHLTPRPRAAGPRPGSRRRDAATGAATARHRASTAAGHRGQGHLMQGFIERGGGRARGDADGRIGESSGGRLGDGFQRSAFKRSSVQRTKPGCVRRPCSSCYSLFTRPVFDEKEWGKATT